MREAFHRDAVRLLTFTKVWRRPGTARNRTFMTLKFMDSVMGKTDIDLTSALLVPPTPTRSTQQFGCLAGKKISRKQHVNTLFRLNKLDDYSQYQR